jgi:hypothetical protein
LSIYRKIKDIQILNLADVIRRFCTLFGVFCLIALGYTEAAG